MISIDGSYGEGGGQIIRSSLALSLITGKPFRAHNVRAGRERPGLQRQHLTAVRAAAEIGRARVEGAEVGSRAFTFEPGQIAPGEYTFSIGTAGSTTLVLQTIILPLVHASAPSVVTLEGGTHNPHAPPFEFLAQSYLPLVARTGAHARVELMRYGFYPPGGGRLDLLVEPRAEARRLDLLETVRVRRRRARAHVIRLSPSVGERALEVVRKRLGWETEELTLDVSADALSPNIVLTLEVESEELTEVFTGVGERGVRVETIAERVCDEAARYTERAAPVGEHLADQLLLPLALARGGAYLTGPLSLHTTTNIEVVKKFLPVEIETRQVAGEVWRIEVRV